ncbi:gamma-glutamyltransferase [Gilvimarinus sp. F26214L]|uniref:gamma-glutamyltransferase n=1 Tax=Gilvimarinus sp. DZF01 TaxID=3461371 RepID=UPI0040464F20
MRYLLLTLCLSLSFQLGCSQAPSDTSTPEPEKTISPTLATGTNGVVTSRSALASEVGVDIMRAGGNAIDAAVATGFALAVTYPSAGNIGGGGFAVIHLADGAVKTLDSRERAPLAAHRDMYLDENGDVIPGMSTSTHAASGVPGTVDGLLRLLDAHGTMSRQEVLAPAIRLAEEGFPLTEDLARQFTRVLKTMGEYPASLAKFSRNGEPYQAGEIWKQPDLAHTLRLISEHGRDGFYKGEVAAKIEAEMEKGRGLITREDLADYHSVWRDPVVGEYRGYTIWGMPPPSSGGALIVQMLNMIEPFDLGAMGWGSPEAIHLMVEAERRAYADRTQYLGDPDYVEVPLAMLTSEQYARQRFEDFDPRRASDSDDIGAGRWPEESPQTTHYSVMDKWGNAVSLTTTLNSSYGNKIVVEGTGILLNNEMDDFSAKPNVANQFGLLGREANAIEPGKRMLSSMSPTIVTRGGKPYLITGSPGGSTIITTTLQIIVNVIDHNMSIDEAVASPRFHHQWKPNAIWHGPGGVPDDSLPQLKELGHKNISARFSRGIGDANSILFDAESGIIHGMKDPRSEGAAVAY